MLIIKWIIGLLVSLLVGHYAAKYYRNYRNNKILNGKEDYNPDKEQSLNNDFLPLLTGLLERFFFTLVIAFNISGGAVAMFGWLGAKMAVNWNRQSNNDAVSRAYAMTALQSGLVSLLFALIGGLICKL